jgi:hypothetical protein
MKKNKMKIAVLGCISVFFIASLILLPVKPSKAETLVVDGLFSRIFVAFKVDQKAAQAWLPAPWKVTSLAKGPFQGSNIMLCLDDRFIIQDGEGKLDKGGSHCLAVLVSPGVHTKTGEFAFFVTRIYWPYDDPHAYKNAVKAIVHREATIKNATSDSGSGSEMWKIQNNAGGILEFQMNYQRGVPKRVKTVFKVRSSVDPNFLRIYHDDYSSDLVKSIPAGIDRLQNCKFRTTIPELRKMFDGSEQLLSIMVNPCRVRKVFLP